MHVFLAPVAMSQRDRSDANRKYVIMCAVDMHPQHMAQQRGFKLFLGNFSPEYAIAPIDSTTFNNTLTDICGEVKNDLIDQLRKQRESCMEHGYEGPFCGVQITLTSVGRVEYCTASVSIIPPDFGELRHLTLATRSFQGRHAFAHIKLWLQTLTKEYFASIMGESVKPHQVFIAGTADQGANVLKALKSCKVPVTVCAAHRLNTSVMQGLGINGSAVTAKNQDGKTVISRGAAVIGVFSHSATRNDNLLSAQEKGSDRNQQEAEEVANKRAEDMEALLTLAGLLGVNIDDDGFNGEVSAETAAVLKELVEENLQVICRNDTRLGSTKNFLFRLSELKPAVELYFQKHPENIKRCLTAREWVAIRELASVLEPASEVTTRIQGNADGFPRRIIFLMTKLRELYTEAEQDVLPASMNKADGCERTKVSRLTAAARVFLKVIATDMNQGGLGQPETLGERVALYLDPRTKSCGRRVCVGRGVATKEQAVDELKRQAANLVNNDEPASSRAEDPSSDSSGVPPPAKKMRSRLEELESEGESSEEDNFNEDGRTPGSARHARVERELEEYEKVKQVKAKKGFDLLQYWKDNATPKIDDEGVVLEPARWPTLAMLARVYHSIDGTSCQAERNFSSLALTTGGLRGRPASPKVEQLMVLRMNADLIREVKVLNSEMDALKQRYRTGAEKACANQAEVAGQVIDFEDR